MRSVDDPGASRPELYGINIGEVVDRTDPNGLGRVRVRIPGIIEPASAWAWPFGMPGGGAKDSGTFWVPALGAEVAVFFKMGDPDHPYYTTANWGAPGGESEVPTASDSGNPDVRVLAMGAYDVVVDTRAGSKKFKIVDKAAADNVLEFDGATRTLTISATTGIKIESSGQIDIEALIVTINGIIAGSGQL